MNPVLADPDVKINMSLDDIIQLTRGDLKNEVQGRYPRNVKRKPVRRMVTVPGREHSVQLMSSSQGSVVCAGKKGLLNVENKRRIAQFVSNREMNSELLKKSKEIIPAEYKLVKTAHGVERVLVPASEYIICPKKKSEFIRKANMKCPCNSFCPEVCHQPPDLPVPLVAAPIYKTPEPLLQNSMGIQTAEPGDEIIVLDSPKPKRHQQEVIDVESNLPVDIVEAKKLFMPGVSTKSKSGLKTLNDRFTLLTGSSQF